MTTQHKAHGTGRDKVALLKCPRIDLRRAPSRQGAALAEIRAKLCYAAEQSVDCVAALYVDIDGAVWVARGRPEPGPAPSHLENIRVGVYGHFVGIPQIRDDIEQHLRDLWPEKTGRSD